MPRAVNAIGLILLGALAAGGGAAFFLYQANTDRLALIAKAEEARLIADEAARSGRTVTDEANRKLDAASQEIAKAQARIRALEEERTWLAKATTLTTSRIATTWKEWINFTLGVTVKLPPTVTDVKIADANLDAGWLVIKPYKDENISTDTAYLVKGHLLIGSKTETSWMFRVQSNANITHVVYVYPNPRVTERTILDALSTLTFRDQ
ncbi:hypothetical protein M0Q28_03465 [Patescibacteria group bacterium]|nr:hypothetical protein [Patescibacteria group bacterium]